MKRIAVLAALLALPALPARAHDQWANGEPVPAWVKRSCCGPEDAHHLTREQVHVTAAGWKVDGYNGIVPFSATLPSPDGSYWIFYSSYSDGSQTRVFCFFAPVDGT